MRQLARGCAEEYLAMREALGYPLLKAAEEAAARKPARKAARKPALPVKPKSAARKEKR